MSLGEGVEEDQITRNDILFFPINQGDIHWGLFVVFNAGRGRYDLQDLSEEVRHFLNFLEERKGSRVILNVSTPSLVLKGSKAIGDIRMRKIVFFDSLEWVLP